MEAELTKLIVAFNGNPVSTGKALRDLLEQNPDEFAFCSLRLLRKGLTESVVNRGYRYLVTLLATKGILMRLLCEKDRMPREESLIIAKSAARVDPLLDISLLRYLLDDHVQTGSAPELDAGRVLEIVEVVSEGSRALPLISQLLKHSDSRIRSKAALLLGRGNRSARFAEKQFEDVDPRVRANALEALWGCKDEESIKLMLEAVDDENNRVAGNALVGLHRAGDARAISRFFKLACHSSEMHRRTAAWAMGESRDPRFLHLLGRMLTAAETEERKTVFRAIAKIKEAAARIQSTGTVRVDLSQVFWDDSRHFRLIAAASGAGGAPLMGLFATNFVISLEAEQVDAYTVEQRPAPLRLAVGFALPRLVDEAEVIRGAVHSALRSLLDRKRNVDCWAVMRYLGDVEAVVGAEPLEAAGSQRSRLFGVEFSEQESSISRVDVEQLSLGSHPTVLREAIEFPGRRGQAAQCGWRAMTRLLEALAPMRGTRHLVVVGLEPRNGQPGQAAEKELTQTIARAKAARIAVHAIAPECCTLTKRLAEETGGGVIHYVNPEELTQALTRIHAAFQHHFVIIGKTPEGITRESHPLIRLQVNSPMGQGEDTLRA